jgi:hypothetical protein
MTPSNLPPIAGRRPHMDPIAAIRDMVACQLLTPKELQRQIEHSLAEAMQALDLGDWDAVEPNARQAADLMVQLRETGADLRPRICPESDLERKLRESIARAVAARIADGAR